MAGGWSTEIGRAPRRNHEDLEIAVPRDALDPLRLWLHEYHLWDTHEGGLRFLAPESVVPDDHEQLWVRRDGASPWLLDLMLTPVTGGRWHYKRDLRVWRPMDEVIRFGPDSVPYQRPEVTLLYMARRRAERDEADFEAVVPLLPAADRAWLRESIALTEPPDHPWVTRLD